MAWLPRRQGCFVVTDVLHLQVHINAPAAKVYEALTASSALRTGLAEYAEVSIADDRFEFLGPTTPQGLNPNQKLLKAQPNQLLRIEWTLDGQPTTVEFGITENQETSIVSLKQDGLPILEDLMSPKGRRDGLHSMHTCWGLALANLAEFVEDRPLTPKVDFPPERDAEIRISVEISAPPSAVFDSLTDPEKIKDWFGWEVDIDPRVGGTTTFGSEGRIVEFVPNQVFAYIHEFGATTRWQLEASDKTTKLVLIQGGYSEDEWDSAAQHEAGWLGSLAELKRMHELGDAWTPLTTELPSAQ